MTRIRTVLLSIALALLAALGAAVAVGATSADAKTFRYAYRIDPASLDPHALAETLHALLARADLRAAGRARQEASSSCAALAAKWGSNRTQRRRRFHLRPNVKFQGGEPFSADDVIFSVKRMKAEGSDMAYTVASVIEVKKIDDLTVDFIMDKPNPILPMQTTSTYIMSKAWSEKNNAAAPASIKAKQENFATTNANGTGAFMIKERQVGVKTVLAPNPAWWGPKESNLTEVIFTPIQSDATRVAALLSGEVDMVYPVPQQDAARVGGTGKHQLLTGFELRTIFVNMDQARDELLESSVKGKNPFKDEARPPGDVPGNRHRGDQGPHHGKALRISPAPWWSPASTATTTSSTCACRSTRKHRRSSWPRPVTPPASRSGWIARTTATGERRKDLPGGRRHAGARRRQGEPAGADALQVFREDPLAQPDLLAARLAAARATMRDSTFQDATETPTDKIGTYNSRRLLEQAGSIKGLTDQIEKEIGSRLSARTLITEALTIREAGDRAHPADTRPASPGACARACRCICAMTTALSSNG